MPETNDSAAVVAAFGAAWAAHDLDTALSIRGVDLFRVRDGKVSEKIAYVKG